MTGFRRMAGSEHCGNCGRHRASCTCGQPYRSGHADPDFYRRNGYCDRPCQECNRLDASEAER